MRISTRSILAGTAGVLFSLAFSKGARAQTTAPPAWTNATATGLGSEVQGGMAVDAAGNTYEAGNFTGSLLIGTTQLISVGNSDGYLAKYAPNGVLLWVRQLGSAGRDRAYEVAVDAAGNAYVSGYFGGSLTLGNGVSLTAPANGTTNNWLFVARYSSEGTAEWAQQASAPETASSIGSSIGVDAQGHVYLAGMFTSSLTVGSLSISAPPYTQRTGTFLARISTTTGAVQALTPTYFYAAGNTQFTFLPRLAVSADGAAYLLNFFNLDIVLPDASRTTIVSRGSTDEIIFKYSPAGTVEWVEQIGGSGKTGPTTQPWMRPATCT
ncbi:SBBP repeat-containing protein [Hymenobacter cellulosilyticus]|uniref:SBBP repeat-containing protein n=1 Tax=Hymenobacter cellulosilyticus TaxID=2932248 RepID=A0A8T9Q0X9_9BACT|nr:SBBP repeat-containing protein [Hymenobacter cellulosilyticus]UOQ71426.1 SBBP repeat-containing protein [Hymenobacter cellulosilyticus]